MSHLETNLEIIKLIKLMWRTNPDLRFGQMLGYYFFERIWPEELDGRHWLHFEATNQEIISKMKELLKDRIPEEWWQDDKWWEKDDWWYE